MPVTVSVVIPAYNAERHLDETLRSARAQTWTDLEIVVVDDGSLDRTAEVAARHAAEDPRVRVVRIANGGAAHARNVGTEAARGRLVAYLDADDLWHPDKIARQVEAIDGHLGDASWGGVYCLHRLVDTAGRVIGTGETAGARGYIYARHAVFKYVANGSSLMVRRDVALAVGGFDTARGPAGVAGAEDLDFELRVAARWKIDVVRRFLVGYRVHPGGASTDALRMVASNHRVIENALARPPSLPRKARALARGAALHYTVSRLSEAGLRIEALRAFGRLAKTDPVLAAVVARNVLTTGVLARRRQAGGEAPTLPSFHEMPAGEVPEARRGGVLRRLFGRTPYLERVDAVLAAGLAERRAPTREDAAMAP